MLQGVCWYSKIGVWMSPQYTRVAAGRPPPPPPRVLRRASTPARRPPPRRTPSYSSHSWPQNKRPRKRETCYKCMCVQHRAGKRNAKIYKKKGKPMRITITRRAKEQGRTMRASAIHDDRATFI